jgi:hypothetical protein
MEGADDAEWMDVQRVTRVVASALLMEEVEDARRRDAPN